MQWESDDSIDSAMYILVTDRVVCFASERCALKSYRRRKLFDCYATLICKLRLILAVRYCSKSYVHDKDVTYAMHGVTPYARRSSSCLHGKTALQSKIVRKLNSASRES